MGYTLPELSINPDIIGFEFPEKYIERSRLKPESSHIVLSGRQEMYIEGGGLRVEVLFTKFAR
jgi:hypothetical protein